MNKANHVESLPVRFKNQNEKMCLLESVKFIC